MIPFAPMRSFLTLILVLLQAAASVAASSAATVNLHNNRWDIVRVEVRVGKYVVCEQNELYAAQELRRGEKLTVTVSGKDVCYRRDADPGHPERGWSSWSYVPVTSGEYDIYL